MLQNFLFLAKIKKIHESDKYKIAGVQFSEYPASISIAEAKYKSGNVIDCVALQKATNGGGTFGSALNLSGTLANGDVIVIVNSSANATLLGLADITNGSLMTFNGNDAVGLFKNDVLVVYDISEISKRCL